jgi:hypothetical protein
MPVGQLKAALEPLPSIDAAAPLPASVLTAHARFASGVGVAATVGMAVGDAFMVAVRLFVAVLDAEPVDELVAEPVGVGALAIGLGETVATAELLGAPKVTKKTHDIDEAVLTAIMSMYVPADGYLVQSP